MACLLGTRIQRITELDFKSVDPAAYELEFLSGVSMTTSDAPRVQVGLSEVGSYTQIDPDDEVTRNNILKPFESVFTRSSSVCATCTSRSLLRQNVVRWSELRSVQNDDSSA